MTGPRHAKMLTRQGRNSSHGNTTFSSSHKPRQHWRSMWRGLPTREVTCGGKHCYLHQRCLLQQTGRGQEIAKGHTSHTGHGCLMHPRPAMSWYPANGRRAASGAASARKRYLGALLWVCEGAGTVHRMTGVVRRRQWSNTHKTVNLPCVRQKFVLMHAEWCQMGFCRRPFWKMAAIAVRL